MRSRRFTFYVDASTLSVSVPPFATAEVLYTLNQPGDYPMHAHTAQAENANGVYLSGIATMITMR